jgi:hypothetical protein
MELKKEPAPKKRSAAAQITFANEGEVDVSQLVEEEKNRKPVKDGPVQRVANKCAAQDYSPEDLFNLFDDDGDEVLTLKEIKDGFSGQKLDLTEAEIDELIVAIDKDTDGVLTLEEWEEVMQPKVDGRNAFVGIMKGLNIEDPIELEEKILDLRYRTSWLNTEVTMLKKLNRDEMGVTRNEKDKKRHQAGSSRKHLVGEIKELER